MVVVLATAGAVDSVPALTVCRRKTADLVALREGTEIEEDLGTGMMTVLEVSNVKVPEGMTTGRTSAFVISISSKDRVCT